MTTLDKAVRSGIKILESKTKKIRANKKATPPSKLEANQGINDPIGDTGQYGLRIFYCPWLPERTKEDREYKKRIRANHPNCCFNHIVGLPTIKFEDDEIQESGPIELMGFNQRMLQHYFNHRRISQNKCRGSGSSELLTIRWMIFKYAIQNTIYNHKCIIAAGTRKDTALEFSKRMKPLLDKIPHVYDKIPTSDSPDEYRFKSGGRRCLQGI